MQHGRENELRGQVQDKLLEMEEGGKGDEGGGLTLWAMSTLAI